MERVFGLLGIFVFLGILYFCSENKKKIDFKLVLGGILLQLILALLILGIPSLNISGPCYFIFEAANSVVSSVLNFADEGSAFLFGPIADSNKMGFIFAFRVLPTIVFFSSLVALLYHSKILPLLIYYISISLSKVLKVSGAESLAASANIFVGQTEAPLMIKPFLKGMTRSELFCVMVGGMATVAGGVLAGYVGLLDQAIPTIAGHLITASVLSAPAAFVCAKILVPETEITETGDGIPKQFLKSPYSSAIDACAKGAADGIQLAINVGGMLLAFIAIIALFDAGLSYVGDLISFPTWGKDLVSNSLLVNGEAKLTLSVILGWVFYPFSILLGISSTDAPLAASLLAKKLVINEFIAFSELSELTAELSKRSVLILSYALCGFANFSSIGIQIGGIGSLAENKKEMLAKLGLKSVLGGTMAAYLTACIAGLLF